MKLTEEQLKLLPEDLQKVIAEEIVKEEAEEFGDNAGDDMHSYTQPEEITEEYKKMEAAKEQAWKTSQYVAAQLEGNGYIEPYGSGVDCSPYNVVTFIGIKPSHSQEKLDEFILERNGYRVNIKREDLFILA